MAAPKLTEAQRLAVIVWLSEGLKLDEINDRGSMFEPPFHLTGATLEHYRKSRGVNIGAIQEEHEQTAIRRGLANKEVRIRRLARLARRMEKDLFGNDDDDRLWTDQVKGIGKGQDFERVEYEEFNAPEVQQYRGLLDDIAKEVGDRKGQVEASGEVKLVWDIPVPKLG